MNYQPYQSTWQNPLVQQQFQTPMMPQQVTGWQQPAGTEKVDGPIEAMNRLLMRYPAHVLTPGFISDPIFDINGRQFYALSIEGDGRRNLETFDYSKHVEVQPAQIDGSQYVSRTEFDKLVERFNETIGALNGVHAAVPATATATAADVQAADAGPSQGL